MLVVDDEAEIRALLTDLLKDEGYQVRTAQSGAGEPDPGNQKQDKPVESDVIPTKGGGQNQ